VAQSEFFKDLSKVEKKYHGYSLQQLKVIFQFAGIVGITVGEAFLVPDWAFLYVTLPTAFLLGTVPTLKYLDKWKKVQRKIELFFIYEDNFYTTGQIRKYESHEFTQKTSVCETDDSTK
jgi:hypothetical protein